MGFKLTNEERVGLTILVLLRYGHLDNFECEKCTDHLKKQRNCLGGDSSFSYSHPLLKNEILNACPKMFIPHNILSFVDQYDYYEKYPATAPKYEEVNHKFWEAVKYFDNKKYELSAMSEDLKSKKKSSDNMQAMRNFKR